MDKHNDFIEQLIAEEKAQTSYDSPLIDETIDGDPDSFEPKGWFLFGTLLSFRNGYQSISRVRR